MAVPTVAWDETTLADTATVATGDNRIRELKTQIREILDVNHIFGSTGSGATWGYHDKLTFTRQESDPEVVADTVMLYNKFVSGVSELHFKDEQGNVMQLTSGNQFIGGIVGEVRIFNGLASAIPAGWAICDGTGSRPNLLARIPYGIPNSSTEPNVTGGANTVTLTASTMPSHSHTITVSTDGDHTHTYWTPTISAETLAGAYSPLFSAVNSFNTGTSSSDGAHTHTASSTSIGTGTSFSILPSYYEAVYIVKT